MELLPIFEQIANFAAENTGKNAEFNARNANNYCLNVDWLSLHLSTVNKFEEFDYLTIKAELTGRTKVFKNVYTIKSKKHNRVIGTYATEAHEQIMPPNHGILKIDNYYLYHYSAKLSGFIEWLLRKCAFKFIGITRLDIAYDFQSFCDKRHPEAFIKSFLRNDILKKHQTKFRVAGNHLHINHFNWISFGSKTSTVNYKLYNKTLEMTEVMQKPWIKREWTAQNFDILKDVWRLEFTINSTTKLLLNETTMLCFHSLETLNLQNIAGLFYYLFEHYFTFVKHNEKQKRKDRMKDVKLLIFPAVFKRLNIVDTNPFERESNRSTKIFINKMNGLQEELRGKDDDFIEDARSMISKLVSVYNLQNWADKKGIEYQKNNYSNDLYEAQKT